MRARSRPSWASCCTGSTSPMSIARRCSLHSWPNTAPVARPIRTCCAIARSSSACACDYAHAAGRRSCFATGHYARAAPARATAPALCRRAMQAKDQSYFLHSVQRAALRAACCFRSASCTKDAGARAGAPRRACRCTTSPTAPASASSASGRSRSSSGRYLPDAPGPIETLDGQVLGQHRGLPFYTLGQRAGLAIGGARGCAPGALVRRAQGSGAQRADRGAAARAARLEAERGRYRAAQLAVRPRARQRSTPQSSCAIASPQQPATRHRCAPDGGARDRIRAAPARRDAGSVRGAVRAGTLPGRRRHRAVRLKRAARAARHERRCARQLFIPAAAQPDIIRRSDVPPRGAPQPEAP